jgi:hypothetical protein
MAIRTINLEKVRLLFKVIRLDMNRAKLNAGWIFVPSQICAFKLKQAAFKFGLV